MNNKITLHTLRAMKKKGEKIAALTCYNYFLSKIMNEAGIDVVLVGDSVGMVELGYENTLPVTIDEIVMHARAVKRGNNRALLVADMPYMSYNFNLRDTVSNAGRLVKEGGAEAVKIEGGREVKGTIAALLKHQIPVVGHIGLTPQAINRLGGYRVQGRESGSKKILFEDAKQIEQYGASMLVLECVPEDLAAAITNALHIPVIGIGAGRYCDGQILVVHDLLGLLPGPTPRFVKQYARLDPVMRTAIGNYRADVKKGRYPSKKNIYT
jgi:3-methyl-2-oxobutanoate hydroxymethyltransferase